MSANLPRTQTGLVPTTYQNKLNPLRSPENWKRLPPRPPAEQYPFRGEKIRNQKSWRNEKETVNYKDQFKKNFNNREMNRTNAKRDEGEETCVASARRGKSNASSKKENTILQPWNDCMQDAAIAHTADLDTSSQAQRNRKKQESRMCTLEYIRRSGRKRRQLEDLQRRLEHEIEEENRMYSLNRSRPKTREDLYQNEQRVVERGDVHVIKNDTFDRKEFRKGRPQHSLIEEMNRIKSSLLNRLKGESDSQSEESEEDKRATRSIISGTDENRGKISNVKYYTIPFSLGDASTLNSLEESISSSLTLPSSHENEKFSFTHERFIVPQDDLVAQGWAENTGIITASPFSPTSTWDNLSYDQHHRIKQRAEELYRSKYGPRVACIPHNINSCWEKDDLKQMPGTQDFNRPKTFKQLTEHVSKDPHVMDDFVSKESDAFCVKTLVTAITKGISSQLEDDHHKNADQNNRNEASNVLQDAREHEVLVCNNPTKLQAAKETSW